MWDAFVVTISSNYNVLILQKLLIKMSVAENKIMRKKSYMGVFSVWRLATFCFYEVPFGNISHLRFCLYTNSIFYEPLTALGNVLNCHGALLPQTPPSESFCFTCWHHTWGRSPLTAFISGSSVLVWCSTVAASYCHRLTWTFIPFHLFACYLDSYPPDSVTADSDVSFPGFVFSPLRLFFLLLNLFSPFSTVCMTLFIHSVLTLNTVLLHFTSNTL